MRVSVVIFELPRIGTGVTTNIVFVTLLLLRFAFAVVVLSL